MSEQKSTYIIKEGQGDDPRIIQKINTTVEIQLDTLASELKYFEKTITELESNAKIKELITKNVLDHNPDIDILPDEKKHAIAMFYEAKIEAELFREKLKEAVKTKAELDQMVKDIEEQTGLKVFDTAPTEEAPVEPTN